MVSRRVDAFAATYVVPQSSEPTNSWDMMTLEVKAKISIRRASRSAIYVINFDGSPASPPRSAEVRRPPSPDALSRGWKPIPPQDNPEETRTPFKICPVHIFSTDTILATEGYRSNLARETTAVRVSRRSIHVQSYHGVQRRGQM